MFHTPPTASSGLSVVARTQNGYKNSSYNMYARVYPTRRASLVRPSWAHVRSIPYRHGLRAQPHPHSTLVPEVLHMSCNAVVTLTATELVRGRHKLFLCRGQIDASPRGRVSRRVSIRNALKWKGTTRLSKVTLDYSTLKPVDFRATPPLPAVSRSVVGPEKYTLGDMSSVIKAYRA